MGLDAAGRRTSGLVFPLIGYAPEMHLVGTSGTSV